MRRFVTAQALVVVLVAGLLVCLGSGMAQADTGQVVNGVQVMPGGTVVNNDAIVYEGGAVIVDTNVTVPDPGLAALGIDPDAPINGCLVGYLCLYAAPHFGSLGAVLYLCCSWQNLVDYAFNNSAESYHNRTGDDVLFAKSNNGGGAQMCVQTGGDDTKLPAGWIDAVSSVKLLGNANC